MSYKYENHKSIPTKYNTLGHIPAFNQPCCMKGSMVRTEFDIQQMKRTMPFLHTSNMKQNNIQHGLAHFRPDDPVYKPIGGRPAGVTWL